ARVRGDPELARDEAAARARPAHEASLTPPSASELLRAGRRPPYIADDDAVIEGEMRTALEALPEKPLISVAMPTYNTPARYLREAMESVRRQHYPEWELVIVDDGSSDGATRRTLERYAARDPRIRVELRPTNAGIAAATNAALAMCEGEFVA